MSNKFVEKVKPYIGRIYNKHYEIVDAVFKKESNDSQNRTYFVLRDMRTGELSERRASRIKKNMDDRDVNISDEENLLAVLKNGIGEILSKKTDPLQSEIEKLNIELKESRETINRLSTELNSIKNKEFQKGGVVKDPKKIHEVAPNEKSFLENIKYMFLK